MPLRNSPGITSGCFPALKSQPETSVRDFAQHLDPSLTLRVGIDGTYSELFLSLDHSGIATPV